MLRARGLTPLGLLGILRIRVGLRNRCALQVIARTEVGCPNRRDLTESETEVV